MMVMSQIVQLLRLRGLRRRILFHFVVIALGATMAIAAMSLFRLSSSLSEDLQEKHFLVSRQAWNIVNDSVKRSRGDVVMLSRNATLSSPSSTVQEKQQELRKLKETLQVYEDLTLMDTRGNIITSTDFSSRGLVVHQSYFKRACKGHVAMSSIRAIPDPFKIVINFAAPIMGENGEPVHVITTQMNMDTIWALFEEIKVGHSGELFLIDAHQRIIGTDHSELLLDGFPIHRDKMIPPAALQTFTHPDGAVTVTGAGYTMQQSRHLEKAWGGINWSVYSVQHQTEARAPFYSLVWSMVIVLAVILASVIAAGVRHSSSLTRPLEGLAHRAELIGKGQWNTPVMVEGTDEIATLAISFNTMQREIKRISSHLQDLVNSMPSAIISTDDACSVTVWNDEAAVQNGVSAEDAIGKPLLDVAPYLETQYDVIRESMRNQTTTTVRLNREPQDAGPDEILELTVFPLSDSASGVVIRIDNISTRIRLSEMVAHSEKMTSLGGIAAGMAHEINNPLSGISQNIQVLRSRLMDAALKGNSKAAAKCNLSMTNLLEYVQQRGLERNINAIEEAAARAAGIVQNMLRFSRETSNSKSVQYLAEIMDETIEVILNDFDVNSRWDFRNIQLMRHYQDVPQVLCDRGRIQQVFYNILKNGAEAMTTESGLQDDAGIEISIFRQGDFVAVDIADNGSGMPEAIQRRVFDPFFTTKGVGQGTGLGLSVAYFIITEDHGGTLSVQSDGQRGTRFSICLPL
jgi:PAS domain S-box-containing protein